MSQAKAIPERSQIAPEFTWNTADLYPTDQAWQEDFSRLQAMVPKLAAYAGRLGESADTLYAYVTLEQEAGELLVKLMDYAQRRSDEDTRVPEYQAMVGKITSQYVALSQAVSFEIPEVLRIPTETLERFYGEKPELELYRRYLLSSRTAGSTPCPTRRRSCWRAWGSWPRPRTTSSPSWPTRI